MVCEPNAEFGADVEVDGSLTINSAKDLKTKDGTSIGGGAEFYEIDMGTEKSHTITEEQFNNAKGKNIKAIYNNKEWYFYYQSTLEKSEYGITACIYSASIGMDDDAINLNLFAGQLLKVDHECIFGIATCICPTGIQLGIDANNNLILALSSDNESKAYVSKINGFPAITSAPSEDIKVQSTLYRHTVDIDAGGLGLHTYVTALSEKNTVIDSIQDLVAVFGNTKLMATGMFGSNSETTAMLEVGTTMLNTYVHSGHGNKLSLSDWANYGPDETNLVITDSVTAM